MPSVDRETGVISMSETFRCYDLFAMYIRGGIQQNANRIARNVRFPSRPGIENSTPEIAPDFKRRCVIGRLKRSKHYSLIIFISTYNTRVYAR